MQKILLIIYIIYSYPFFFARLTSNNSNSQRKQRQSVCNNCWFNNKSKRGNDYSLWKRISRERERKKKPEDWKKKPVGKKLNLSGEKIWKGEELRRSEKGKDICYYRLSAKQRIEYIFFR